MKTIRAFSTSPAKRWWLSGRSLLLMPMAATWALLFGFNLGRTDWGPWVFAAIVLVLATAELFTAIVPLAHRRLLRTLRSIHQQLPWFDADMISWLQPEREQALRQALADAGAVVHELDGGTIRTMDDLLRELGVSLDPRWNRLNVVQRPLAAMTTSLPKDGKVHAFVWRDAQVFAQHDPALLHRFVSEWRLQQPTRSLLFLVAPAPVTVVYAARLAGAAAP